MRRASLFAAGFLVALAPTIAGRVSGEGAAAALFVGMVLGVLFSALVIATAAPAHTEEKGEGRGS